MHDEVMPDRGCSFASRCLSCPYALCIYDVDGGKRRWLIITRSYEITERRRQGWSQEEIAAFYRISIRTVGRALARRGQI